MSAPRIGPEEQAHYMKHGYVVVPGLFDRESLERWKERFRAIVDGEVEPAVDATGGRGTGVVRRGR